VQQLQRRTVALPLVHYADGDIHERGQHWLTFASCFLSYLGVPDERQCTYSCVQLPRFVMTKAYNSGTVTQGDVYYDKAG
jgi:hypothetical protein